jgi:hypothetical protein
MGRSSIHKEHLQMVSTQPTPSLARESSYHSVMQSVKLLSPLETFVPVNEGCDHGGNLRSTFETAVFCVPTGQILMVCPIHLKKMTRQLVSKTCVELLTKDMLRAENPLTVGMGIIIEVIRKNNSDYDPEVGAGRGLPPSSSDPIYLGTLLRLLDDSRKYPSATMLFARLHPYKKSPCSRASFH